MNLGLAIVIAAALIGAGFAISHRYEISAHACTANSGNCSRVWRVDQWTGHMMFCEHVPQPPAALEPACTEPKFLSSVIP
jgi:hypothetical protein